MGSGGRGKHPDTSSCWARAVVQGSICPALLLVLLGLLGACGPPPRMTHSQPFDAEQLSSFPVGSRVTYTCLHGAVRIPGVLDTVQCLPGSRWSELRDPCGLSCTTPTTLHFAALSEADEMINFYPAGFTVSYVCRPGYENISESQPTSTCLEDLTWSEVPDIPILVLYLLLAQTSCWLKGDDVEWSELPTCELITCSSPPWISNGRHDGEGVEKFAYNSTVTYSCDSGFQLIGNVSIHCTRAGNARGVWSGAVPQCKEWPGLKRTTVLGGGSKVTNPLTNPAEQSRLWFPQTELRSELHAVTISYSQSFPPTYFFTR
uniref:Sushi domain-containing protein n=1 Tax=Pavo cristatus TaxID=9049 RepID=A0A8C9F1X3_PAVCR